MAAATRKTRILIISDTHSALPSTGPERTQPYHHPLPEADVLVHCGDLTSNGQISQHERTITLLKSHSAPLKLVIPGNHDLTLDREYYAHFPLLHGPRPAYDEAQLDDIEALYTGPEAKQGGIEYLVEGTRSFVLSSGARLKVYASPYTPEFCKWAFAYSRMVDRFNPPSSTSLPAPAHPIPDYTTPEEQIDLIVTHGPPFGILDETVYGGKRVGCESLRTAVERCKPKIHCFGHIHEAWGALWKKWDTGDPGDEVEIQVPDYEAQVQQGAVIVDATRLESGRETLFINASVMSVRYKPVQAPWVVEIDLPVAES